MAQNTKLVNEVNTLAERKGVAPVQIALAWILSPSGRPGLPTIIPIPGSTTSDKVRQNLVGVSWLSDGEMEEIAAILQRNEVVGESFHQSGRSSRETSSSDVLGPHGGTIEPCDCAG
ncbi:uncharacterized protein BO97DRAFT_425474 [Aspergillus homomorphus CBS 101889]|uniref:NADP-dependent oxidoreductase domain-containing protein n=1 Tax=Aspergillus homomorphus (strain CBS 101889) TaxID=1450537 RepID=A0A395HUI0_ASPHC|nr:hypothetical protein BO97DRAFT_425474 [Aspergillus homomorphus CBS 101889]RAL11477.1 hypothetical protein BO97DRAFT_425474 [Aspergillus homomorphus CBS 101889]